MYPTDIEPRQEQLEAVLEDEERRLLEDPRVPDDVRTEISERLERFHEQDAEASSADAAG